MVSTNVLKYDPAAGIYYKDKNMLAKTQLFSVLGIDYSVLKNKKALFQVGPLFQYGLTRLAPNYHLFSLGLTGRLFLEK
jgi:hypothetical protein